MVMLGGWQHGLGAVLGAAAWVGLHDALIRSVEHWRAAMGLLLLLLVMGLPKGLAGLLPQSLQSEGIRPSKELKHG
jgi:branched-chain amino acid transport system permease protein